ncbi:MAG: hypothetical protein HOQ02_05055 [Lysobacter sp.]|nr:hypothetical protein [Lysobacter sp.]
MAPTPQSDAGGTRPRAARFPYLMLGLVFLGVGLATHQAAFLTIGPAFIAIGIAFLARARRGARPPHH